MKIQQNHGKDDAFSPQYLKKSELAFNDFSLFLEKKNLRLIR